MKQSMNYILALILCVFGLSSCNTSSNIQVSVEGIPAQKVVLQQIKGPDFITIDSADVEEGNDFKLAAAPTDEGMYRVLFQEGKYIMLALEKGDKASVKSKWSDIESYDVSGSQKSAIVKQLVSSARKSIIDMRTYKLIFDSLKVKGDEAGLKKVEKEFQMSNENLRTYLKQFADTTMSAVAALMALNIIDPKLDAPYITKFYEKVEERFPHNQTVKVYKERFAGTKGISSAPVDTERGNPAPDFEGTTPDGKTIRLQDFRGKYVLIDFWAAWCRPCRAENPNVVKAYQQFKDKGFDILGVSLDNDKGNWQAAIKQDGLTWKQISELKGWSSTVAQKYGVRSIPMNFLVDPDGYIIANNLRGESLINKLKEVFK